MCIALPGRVVSINGNEAQVDFSGNLMNINIGIVSAAPGDYVLTHAGCAIEVMMKEKAEEILSIFADLE
ncbi:MAG: HypC/HybG/HupF family hydrogenase formation chaperone [Clostridiales Family XIII bacterium]|jgi:hydrogenase expression/formation protein HypC|nr:HypC/HybG/HupF family hydrogenase formation chaperone [Clostridiales Family XIII bacterium]